jgi:hypothetical protein
VDVAANEFGSNRSVDMENLSEYDLNAIQKYYLSLSQPAWHVSYGYEQLLVNWILFRFRD